MSNLGTITPRDALLWHVLKAQGDWGKIFAAIKARAGEEIDPEKAHEMIDALTTTPVTILEEEKYPAQLKEAVQPPFALFAEGDIGLLSTPAEKILSFAGAKNAAPYAIRHSSLIGAECAKRGIVLCAQLSRGCSMEALRACSEAGGKCIIMMPGTLGRADVVDSVLAAGGVVVSEFPDGAEATAESCMRTNRIVAAMGRALFAPQVSSCTESAVAVAFALNYGKDVATLPFEAGTAGVMNNGMISDGAILVENAGEFLEEEYR